MAERDPEGAALLTDIAVVENTLTSHTFLLMGDRNSVACG
jgi:hypothetical protein